MTPAPEAEVAVATPAAVKTESVAAAPVAAAASPAADDAKADRAKARVRRDTKYGSGEAVNSRMAATETDEKRATFVTVVGKIDPALQQNLVESERCSPTLEPRKWVTVAGAEAIAPWAIAPPPQSHLPPTVGTSRARRSTDAKKRRGGRVAYDQDARFDDVRRQRNVASRSGARPVYQPRSLSPRRQSAS